jgi:hypothetical protein
MTGQPPQGCSRNPNPAVDPDSDLARKLLGAAQSLSPTLPFLSPIIRGRRGDLD